MKYIRRIVFLLPAIVLSTLFVSCAKDFQSDIDKLNSKHENVVQRVESLEASLKTTNLQLKTLSVLSEAVERGFYITTVKTSANGYELTLNNGRTIELFTTANNTLSPVPPFSMTQINGLFYWTINGMLFIDDDGKPIHSSGQSPVLKYDYSINQWLISTNGGVTYKDINDYASVFIDEQVLTNVINSFASQTSNTLFNKQLLYQIVSTYIQKSYKELFNDEMIDEVVKKQVKERYTRIFNYELLNKIFSQYNYEYVSSNIKVEELVGVIVDFIKQHNEIFEDNEILYEIVSSFLTANKSSVFTEDMLREAVDKFIEENQSYINIDLLTSIITNYIDTHTDEVFNTETVRRLLTEYVEKYCIMAFKNDILIKVFNICIMQNSSFLFNEKLITEIVNQYISSDFYSVIDEEKIENLVRDYIAENSSEVFNRDLIIEIISKFLSTYEFHVEKKDIERKIEEYILVNKAQIIDIDIVTSIIKSYVKFHYEEIFNVNVLKEIVINYLNDEKERIVLSIHLGNDPVKTVDVDDEKCIIKLSDGKEIELVVYDIFSNLSKRVQSMVAMAPDGHFEQPQETFIANYLVSPTTMADILKSKFNDGEVTMILKGLDENGEVSNIKISSVTADNKGILQISANLDTKKYKAVALYARENKIAGTDIMTEFTVVGNGVTPCRGDIPEDPNPNDTPTLPSHYSLLPYPATSTDKDECDNYVVTMTLSGIQTPNDAWLELFGTGELNQNVWVEVDGIAKGIKAENLSETSRMKNDIVFTVDNSGSMNEEADAIANGIKEWADMLNKKGLDVRFGNVGYGFNTGINGAIDITTSANISTYLNRSSGTSRTVGFNEMRLKESASKDPWVKKLYENGVRAVLFANKFFSFRNGSNRIYINFTDDCNHTDNSDNYNDFSVNYFNDHKNWPVSNGTIHSVISEERSKIEKRRKDTYELPWLMSDYTNGITQFVDSKASDLNLTKLNVSDAITHSYTIRFIIPDSLLDGRQHKVRIVVKDSYYAWYLEFDTVFSL